jgi:hypothetical protein
MASTYLTKTPSSAGNRKTWTYSAWIKLGSTATMQLFSAGADSSNYNSLRITQTGLRATNYNSSNTWNIRTNALLRDTNAWYHIVLRVDTTQSTASDRARLYINGELQTSLLESSYPAQNQDEYVNNTNLHAIGTTVPVNSNNFDGSMSHIHLCDGYSYDASAFGSTDSTTGEWKINTSPSVSYGTNGFFILKDGNSVTDQSGQSNNYTVATGTLTKTEDCPSNVFATLNPLDKGKTGTMNFANGNTTTMNTSGFGDYGVRSTLGVNSGKFYWEIKIGSNTSQNAFAIQPMDVNLKFDMFGSTPEPHLYGLQQQTTSATNFYNNTTFTSGNTAWGGGLTSSDVVGFALDMDNGKLYISKNGAFKDMSGNTSNLSSGTYPTFTISDTSKTYGLYVEMRTNDDNGTKVNFGNGYFGTTAVSNAGTNASGIGIFEYDVPTGYTALSTKGLNE